MTKKQEEIEKKLAHVIGDLLRVIPKTEWGANMFIIGNDGGTHVSFNYDSLLSVEDFKKAMEGNKQ